MDLLLVYMVLLCVLFCIRDCFLLFETLLAIIELGLEVGLLLRDLGIETGNQLLLVNADLF